MPYKSDSQRRFFHSAGAKKAGITKKEVKEFDKASKGKKLPEKKKSYNYQPKTLLKKGMSKLSKYGK